MKQKKKNRPNHVPLTLVLAEFWPAIRRYWLSGILILVLYGVASILQDLALPYVLKLIIDSITLGSIETAWPTVVTLFIWFAALHFVFRAFWRVGDFLIVYFQIHVMRALDNQCFSKLQLHSYKFFGDNFVGSLVTKARRFVNAFETIHDQLAFNFWLSFIQLTGVTIIFWLELPKLALFFLAWTVVYLGITFYLMRYQIRFDLASAAASSRVTGRLADVMTNVINLKVFSAGRRESKAYWDVTTDLLNKRSKSWYFHMWILVYQATAVAILEVVGMWIALIGWQRGLITAGTVVLVQVLIAKVTGQLWNIGRAMTRVIKSLSDAEEMVAILHQPLDVRDASPPIPSKMTDGLI
ncbi:MAG: ABC transporter ATP-binding protein, partial [Gammaproteobacteria bacterium]|nr:ABC transporter ATP-binding protein [Gammaproteobacteria bacterium]